MSVIFSGGITGACFLAPLAFLFTGVVFRFETVNFNPAPGGSTNTPWFLAAGVVALLAGVVGFLFGAFLGCLVRWRSRAAPTRRPYLQAAVTGASVGSAISVVRIVPQLMNLFNKPWRPSVLDYAAVGFVWRPYLVWGLAYGILVAVIVRSRLPQAGLGQSEPGSVAPQKGRSTGSWVAVWSLMIILVVAVVWAARQESKY